MFDSITDLVPGMVSGGGGSSLIQLGPPQNLVITASPSFIVDVVWDDAAFVPTDYTIELWESDMSEQINSNSVAGGIESYQFTGLESYVGVGVVVIMRNNGDGTSTITSSDVTSSPVNVTEF